MRDKVYYFSRFLLGQIVSNPDLVASVPESQATRDARLAPSHGLHKMRFSNLVHPKSPGASDPKEDSTVSKARDCKVQLFSADKVPEPLIEEKCGDYGKEN